MSDEPISIQWRWKKEVMEKYKAQRFDHFETAANERLPIFSVECKNLSGKTMLMLDDYGTSTMAEEQAAFWPQHPTMEPSRYGTGPDDESEAEPERNLTTAQFLAMRVEPTVAAEEPSNHDYVGPVVDGKAVPDPVHERVHHVVGDILAGRVLPDACKQVQEALKNRPGVKAPFPVKATGVDIGLKWRV